MEIGELRKIITSKDFSWEKIKDVPEEFKDNSYSDFFYLTTINEKKFKLKENFLIKQCDKEYIWEVYLKTIKKFLEKNPGKLGKSFLVKLKNQGYPTREYYDFEQYEKSICRYYIPIVSNKDSFVCVNETVYNLSSEKIIKTYYNDLVSVYNLGNDYIIYLSLDIVIN